MNPLLRESLKPIFGFLWLYVFLHVCYALANWSRASDPWIWAGTLVMSMAVLVMLMRTHASWVFCRVVAILCIPIMVWVHFTVLSQDRLESYANWWPGMSAGVSALFVIFGYRWSALISVIVSAGSAWFFASHFMGLTMDTVLYATRCLMGSLTWVLAVVGIIVVMGRLSDRQRLLERDSLKRMKVARENRRLIEKQREEVAALREVSVRHLESIARLDPRVGISDAQRQEWDLGALSLRDELSSRPLLDHRMRSSIFQARRRGAKVEMQDGMRDGGKLDAGARQVILGAIDSLGADDELTVRRQAGRRVVSIMFDGPNAEKWFSKNISWPDDAKIIHEEHLVHVVFDQDAFSQTQK